MRNICSIYKKELNSYFNSPVAYIVITVFLLFSGWFFSSNFFLMGQATVRTALTVIPLIFIFFVPAITMRSIAEEKKSGTIELLVTMPTRDMDIILGKFFAALTLLIIAILFTLGYVITAGLLGNLDGGPTFGGYLGLILLGSTYLAIGIFASSTTENQIVAFIIGFAIIFVFFMLDKVLIFMPTSMVSILEYLSTDYHFNSLARGVIDTRDIIYYLSLTAFALVLAGRSLESRKW
ncbi:ABC transporter [candidate division LCP-89 bacterium B3_LCP]|uniref:ABC transporter n=1 Tax=candidate division LCP-89 bacterium B3_LCP TaxID=2012998 RepID=A0A532V5P6_UNCL8|nr:MAG: ABC transporter [candidate division LCP-89 bacterium B3_LCP]